MELGAMEGVEKGAKGGVMATRHEFMNFCIFNVICATLLSSTSHPSWLCCSLRKWTPK